MSVEDEKAVALYEHRLNVRRLILEKILLGMLLAGIAYLGNYYLENYKSSLTTQRFLLESRLEALKELQEAHSQLTEQALQALAAHSDGVNWDRKPHKEAVRKFAQTTNKWKLLFSKEFDTETTRYIWFHQALAFEDANLTRDDWSNVVGIFEGFDEAAKSALITETLGGKERKRSVNSKLPKWGYKELQDSGGPKAFLEEIKKMWIQKK